MLQSFKEIINRTINSRTGNRVSDFISLLRLYYNSWKNRFSDEDIIITYNNYQIKTPDLPLLINLINEIFLEQTYYFKSNINDPFIIDCGANLGLATLYFKYLYPESKIIGFEANPDLFEYLNFNIKVNHLKNVEVVNAALTSKPGQTHLYVPKKYPFLNASLIENNSDYKKSTVKGIRLSEFITEKVDLLKIDIEGAEDILINELIESGKIELVNMIIFEYHQKCIVKKDDLTEMLISEGFDLLNDQQSKSNMVTLNRKICL